MLINNQKHLQVGGRIRTLPLVMCQEPVWVPKVIQTSAPDLKVTPAVEEMVRLEGHYWAKSWAKGRKIEIGFAGFSRGFLNIYHLHFIYISFIYRHIIHTIMHIYMFFTHVLFFCQSNSNYHIQKPEPTHWTCLWKLCWPGV